MKILYVLLITNTMIAKKVDFTSQDIWNGYNRIFEYDYVKDNKTEQHVLDMFEKRGDVLKDKAEKWCAVCQYEKDFETCLAQKRKEIIGTNYIDQMCVTNIVMAKIEAILCLFKDTFYVSKKGYRILAKIALFETKTKE